MTSIPAVVADALGLTLSSQEDARSVVKHFLAGKQLLLVLDNFEQLLKGTPFVRELIASCPRLKLLITSRERLNLESEWVFAMEGLTYPEEAMSVERAESFDAVQLFVQRARQTRHGFTLTGGMLPAVMRICELVGGMPLAIELAASWLHVLPPSGIAEQLEESLELLEGSTRNLPARHRGIRAVFNHSWELPIRGRTAGVGAPVRCSVAGFTLEAAKTVAGASLPILASLSDKSMVTLSPTGRYAQHPLVLEYAQERLEERPQERTDTEEKHGVYYLSFLEEHLSGIEQQQNQRGPCASEGWNSRTSWPPGSGRPTIRSSSGSRERRSRCTWCSTLRSAVSNPRSCSRGPSTGLTSRILSSRRCWGMC